MERLIPPKDDFITYVSGEKGACHVAQGHMGRHQVWSGGRKGRGEDPGQNLGVSMRKWSFHGKSRGG